jgi:hypothetical protein
MLELWKYKHKIEDLRIQGNNLTDEGLKLIANNLDKFPCLKQIGIGSGYSEYDEHINIFEKNGVKIQPCFLDEFD